MNILVACEESQRVTEQLRKRGHNAFSCDIMEQSGDFPEWHIRADVLPLLNGDCSFVTSDGKAHHLKGKWDMIIAFPPCTYMTAAGACRMYPQKGKLDRERLEKGLAAKAFFFAIWNADCERIAIENPRPLHVIQLPKETQRIQPFQFGEPFTKQTYLWLKGLPKLKETDLITENITPFVNAGTYDANGNRRKKTGVKHSQKERSKTFTGIARAMAEQWTKEK